MFSFHHFNRSVRDLDCTCFVNRAMGVCFIQDRDGCRLNAVPAGKG